MRPEALRRAQLLGALTTVLTLVGIVLATLQPAWLTGALNGAVQVSGAAAPLVYVLLCALTAPLHLTGLLVALSTVTWPAPVAWTLSFTGTLLGSVVTGAVLYRSGAVNREGWPQWLIKLAASVARRPVLVAVMARLGLGTGAALEAFFVLTGYPWRRYLWLAALGCALWTTQALYGVVLLRAVAQASPLLAGLVAGAPLLLLAAFALQKKRLTRRNTA
jgi:hypothetical protein